MYPMRHVKKGLPKFEGFYTAFSSARDANPQRKPLLLVKNYAITTFLSIEFEIESFFDT